MAQFITEDETANAVKKLLSKKMINLAKETLHEGIRAFPDSNKLCYLQAHIATEQHDFNTAAHLYVKLLKEEPDKPEFLLSAAQAWNRTGHADKALSHAERFLEVTNNNPDGLFAIADILERNNHLEEAEEVMEKLPAEALDHPKWRHMQSRILIARKEYELAVDLILKHWDQLVEGQQVSNIVGTQFLLCKAYDRLGEYDKAWEAAKNAHDQDDTPFNEEVFFTQFEEMRSFMTREILDALVEGPTTDLQPLFIVGNPRSGTSLLEQILSMHPDIQNGGEMSVGSLMQMDVSLITDSYHSWPYSLVDLRESEANQLSRQYCEETEYFRNGKKIISNKALNIPVQLGFLTKILPSSRAILLHRHPLDNAVSCYTTNLISSGHAYTNTLETLGRTWVERKKMSDLWLDILPIPVMELHYEELVVNQRAETERLIKFLDLPWQEDCMKFHESKYVARTISYDQVNRKMYTTSSGRWKNYEKHLCPLIDIVSDYI